MESVSGVLITSKRGLVYAVEGSLYFWKCDETPTCLLPNVGVVEFLSASPDGKCCALYSEEQTCFYVVTLDGHVLWRHGINTDKTAPMGLRFSSSGDGIACFDDWDGGKRVHFYSRAKRYTSDFGPSREWIGLDPELRRFLVFDQTPGRVVFSIGGLAAFQPGAPSSPGSVVLLDRRGTVRARWSEESWPITQWRGAAIDRANGQFVVADGETLSWVSWNPKPCVTREVGCSLDGDILDLTIYGSSGSDAMLLQAREYRSGTSTAVLLRPSTGETWRASSLRSVWPFAHGIVVHHSVDNRIEVIGWNGEVVTRVRPVYPYCLGASVFERKVWVAECTECYLGNQPGCGHAVLPFQDLRIRCVGEL